MSGDTGFYSGAKKLAEALAGKYEYSIMAGVSSVIYLAAKIGKSWENAAFVSLHGKKQSYCVLPSVRTVDVIVSTAFTSNKNDFKLGAAARKMTFFRCRNNQRIN